MNRRTSISIDILWVVAIMSAIASFAAWFAGDGLTQVYSAVWACFCLLMAILLCVYR